MATVLDLQREYLLLQGKSEGFTRVWREVSGRIALIGEREHRARKFERKHGHLPRAPSSAISNIVMEAIGGFSPTESGASSDDIVLGVLREIEVFILEKDSKVLKKLKAKAAEISALGGTPGILP